MRIPCEILCAPLINTKWWTDHVHYSKFRRQGIDIICASFIQPKSSKANVIFVTGLTESFIKYSEIIQLLYENGFNVFTYDHQSQGLSGRWLTESQSLWVHTFDDYVDDFMYFVTTISKDFSHLPIFVLAHSMGGFIAANAMCRLPTLVNRAILCSPMIRCKCGVKALDFRYPLPETIAYWFASLNNYLGLGTYHTLGYFKEKPTDRMNLNVVTSDQEQLDRWIDLRMRYPNLITTCVTNDWIYHTIKAQKKFASKYEFVKTNTLILR